MGLWLKGESACTTFKTFTSFKTGVQHKQLLWERGGACSLPEVGEAFDAAPNQICAPPLPAAAQGQVRPA